MKGVAAISASVLAGVAYAGQSGPACNAVAYDMSAHPGSVTFSTVTKYSWDMSGCAMSNNTYNSPIAPLDQGLTAVFRGPLKLKQFAVYNEGAPSKKRSPKASPRERRHHNHERFHKHRAEAGTEHVEKRACGDQIVATFSGVVGTMTEDWDCAGATPAPAAPAASTPAAPAVNINAAVSAAAPAPASASAAPAQASQLASGGGSPSSDTSSGAWNQVAYYSSSSPSSAKNVTFLYPVPYANTDFLPSTGDMKDGPASSAQILGDVLIADDDRFYVNSGVQMDSSAAPNNKAYHGFAGNKIFLVEMSMPMSGLRGQGQYPDAPAFWLLNEQLPATSDSAQCNCWASGCGEFDVHEIITPGNTIGYSTFHMGQQWCGGASNGFQRVTDGTQKLAVIIKAGSGAADSVVRIVVLDDSYNFGDSISEDDYSKWVSMTTAGGQNGVINNPATSKTQCDAGLHF